MAFRPPSEAGLARFNEFVDVYFESIPEAAIDMEQVIRQHSGDLGCGTVACAVGWAMLSPIGQASGLRSVRDNIVSLDDNYVGLFVGARMMFDFDTDLAEMLFTARNHSEFDVWSGKRLSDKKLFKHRVKLFRALLAERAAS